MNLPFFHLHRRQRIHTKKERYPHPDPTKRLVDRLVYFAGVVTPILTAEQAYTIFAGRDASGVSLITYAGFTILNIIWL